jgi:hypothetical protein
VPDEEEGSDYDDVDRHDRWSEYRSGEDDGDEAWVAAILSAILAFLSSIATALGGAETGFDSITSGQWLTAVIAAIVALGSAAGLTYAVPNKPK